MAKITGLCVGESLVGEGNEVAHIDLIIDSRSGPVGAAFVNGRIYLPGGSVTQGTAAASSIHWTYRPEIACG